MSTWPSDYVEKVLDDVKKYNGIRKTVRASLFERCAVKHCDPERLHPNPEDEFSQEDIGPNLEIVGGYVEDIKFPREHSKEIFEEAIIVQKMEPDGYLLLNGHHRWFAALRMNVKKVHINIVNMVSETDLSRMMSKSDNTKLVSFDFDEVLITAEDDNQAPLVFGFFSKKYSERLKKGAPEIIKAFQDNGYDVCVYTSGYLSEDDFKDFFSMYDLDVNIVVNGLNEKRKNSHGNSERIKELLRNKYKYIAHVDEKSVIYTDHITKEFEIFELDAEMPWEKGVVEKLSVMK